MLRDHDGGVGQHLVEGKFNFLQHHLAGLNLGDVQDVTDDTQQMLRGNQHFGQLIALPAVRSLIHRQPGHADDGIERGADFVTHIGEKIRFCLRRLPDQLGRLAGEFLHFALGHQAAHRDTDKLQPIRQIGQASELDFNRKFRPRLAQRNNLPLQQGFRRRAEKNPEVPPLLFPIVFGHNIGDVHVFEFVSAVSQKLLHTGVGEVNAAAVIDDQHAFRRQFKNLPIPSLGLSQLQFCTLELAHVGTDQAISVGFSSRVL